MTTTYEHESDSDSDAPEAVTLAQSKKSIQKQHAELRKVEAFAKEQARLKNREKDQKLKARAALNKGKSNTKSSFVQDKKRRVVFEDDSEEEEGPDGIEARMLKAMKDAEVEEDGDTELDDPQDEGAQIDDDEDEGLQGLSFDSVMDDNDSEEGETDAQEDEDEDMDSEFLSESVIPHQPKKLKSSNYLPDEIFKAAFSQASKPSSSEAKAKKLEAKKEKVRKRKRATGQKDVIIGSKAIRTLSTTKRPIQANAAVPSSKINKFLDRTLALKSQRGKSWERKPANIGVLRRSGPAAHFVRT